nr:MAG: ORF1a protein [Jingmen bat astrovirus 2]
MAGRDAREIVAGANYLDAAFGLGNPGARTEAIILDRNAKTKLADLVPKTSICAFHYLWSGERKSVAFSTSIDGDVKTWYYDDKDSEWRESYPIIKTSAIVATSLAEDRARLQEEVRQLSQNLAQARLDHELCRHEVERLRQNQEKPGPPRNNFLQKFLIGLLFGLILFNLFGVSHAQKVTETKHETFSTVPLKYWYQEFYEALIHDAKQAFQIMSFFIQTYWLEFMWHLWDHWLVHLIVFMAFAWTKYQSVTPTLILMILSVWSRWRQNAFMPLANADIGSLVAHCVGMFLYPFDIRLSAIVTLAILVANVTFCVITGDNAHGAVAGALTVAVVYGINILCDIIGLPKVLPTTIWVLYKVFSIIMHKPASVIVKDSEGKVVETTNVAPGKGAFSLWSKFKQWRQKRTKPRSSIDPVFVVPTHATGIVKTSGGEGTFFRVQNYLVTAKHVVGDDDTVEIVYNGVVHAAQVKWKHPSKDIAYMTLPNALQNVKPMKIAKEHGDGFVAIVIKAGEHVHFAVSHGVVVGDEITYAVSTPDGSSGSPVVCENGRVVGVHVTNTGFSAGAVILTNDDLPPIENKAAAEIAALKAEIEKLKNANMQQSSNIDTSQIIALIREAIAREMTILRTELASDEFEQKKKGKNKRRGVRGGKKKKTRRVWTEKEYKEMLEKGFTREQLQAMAEEIRNREDDEDELGDEDPSLITYDEEAGYPEYDDIPDDDEANEIWFRQRYTQNSKSSDFHQLWCDEFLLPPNDVKPSELESYFHCPKAAVMTEKCRRMVQRLNDLIKRSVNDLNWVDNLDTQLLLEDLVETYYKINEDLYRNDLPLFFQSKNVKRAPKKNKGPQK